MMKDKELKTILLVDDEKDLCEVVSDVLEEANYKVIVAYDGVEGIRKFKNQKFDLVITDLKMPKKSGIEVIRAVRGLGEKATKQDVAVPIVVLSGNIESNKPELAVVENIHLFYKPFNRDELILLVDSLLKEGKEVYKKPSGKTDDLLTIVAKKLNEMVGIVTRQDGEISNQTLSKGPKVIVGDYSIQHSYAIGSVRGRFFYNFKDGLGPKFAEILSKTKEGTKIEKEMIYQTMDLFAKSLNTRIAAIVYKKHKNAQFGRTSLYSGEIFVTATEGIFQLTIKTRFGDLEICNVFSKKS